MYYVIQSRLFWRRFYARKVNCTSLCFATSKQIKSRRLSAMSCCSFEDSKVKVVICGSGHGAHALAGIATSQPNTEVTVLTSSRSKAQRWTELLELNKNVTVRLNQQGQKYNELKTNLTLVTHDPEKALPGCDVVVFVVAAFAHEKYLSAIRSYIEPGMILVGLPGQAGFEFQCKAILGELTSHITLLNYESLPWTARLAEFGISCDVLGIKDSLMGAMQIGLTTPRKDPYSLVTRLIGSKPVLTTRGHLLAVSLLSVNAYLHTSILYDRWENWNGKPLDHKPLSYHGLSQDGASLMSRISDEVLAICKEISNKCPHVDLSQTMDILDWITTRYPNDIKDCSTLQSAITSNEAYRGLTHPMSQTNDGKWIPDFTHRYVTEDIPYGLVVIRGIAEIAGVLTPNMDRVITWAQEIMKKEYLLNGKLQGADIKETRAPQSYGFTTLSDMI